jgi:hypothetical protein
LENRVVDGRIISKISLIEVGMEDTNWIDLAKDRNRWRAVVNAVMNLRDP